ncbi:MAG: hypothetical protein ACRDFR_08525, partial [Candidatus Limnocylindria bacterium]
LLDHVGLAGSAVAGTIAGHVLTYVIAIGNPWTRRDLLHETGHSYWRYALLAAAVLALWSSAFVVIRTVRGARAADPRAPLPLLPTAARLALIQCGLFVAIEVAERLVAGAPLGHLLAHNLLWVGLAAQVVTALAMALVLRALARLTEILATAPRTAYAPGRVRTAAPVPALLPSPALLVGAWGVRGPPSP